MRHQKNTTHDHRPETLQAPHAERATFPTPQGQGRAGRGSTQHAPLGTRISRDETPRVMGHRIGEHHR